MVMDMWEILDHCAQVEPACTNRVEMIKELRLTDSDTDEAANLLVTEVWSWFE